MCYYAIQFAKPFGLSFIEIGPAHGEKLMQKYKRPCPDFMEHGVE